MKPKFCRSIALLSLAALTVLGVTPVQAQEDKTDNSLFSL